MSEPQKPTGAGNPGSKEREIYMWQKPEDPTVPKVEEDDVTFGNAVKTIKPDDFKDVVSIPCAKTSLESGIITATLAGAGRFVWKGNFKSAANWAVTFGLAVSAGAFEYCGMTRNMERIAMKKMIEVHNEKTGQEAVTMGPKQDAIPLPLQQRGMQIDKTLSRAQREAAMIKAREAEQAVLKPKKSWWKFW